MTPQNLQSFQSMLFFDIWLTAFVVLITTALLIFKFSSLGFPSGQFGIEFFVIILFVILSYLKIRFGMIGNRTEQINCILLMIFLGVFSGFCNFYFLFGQTYIMVIEVVLNSICITFTGLEIIQGLIVSVRFQMVAKNDDELRAAKARQLEGAK